MSTTPNDEKVASSEAVENCSVEVHRDGPTVWLSIRSEERVGTAIGLTREDAHEVAGLLKRAADAERRPIRDLSQA